MATAAVETTILYDQVCRSKLIEKIRQHVDGNDKFFSLEFFPPRTRNGTFNLFEKCNRLSQGQPLFCDMTCNAHDELASEQFFNVASTAHNITQCDTMLQLNTAQLTEEIAMNLLLKAKRHGFSTLMIVSDTMKKESSDFSCTSDLIQFVKQNFNSYFTICVAGYPSVSDRDSVYEQSFEHLIDEIDAGADFIITQIVFDATIFLNFMKHCRSNGITVPIIPGIYPIQSYGCIQQLSRYSQVPIPERIMNVLKPIRHNDEAVLKYGIYLTVQLCKTLLQSMLCAGLHFFTLNREIATTQVLKQVGLWREPTIPRKVLPWLSENTEGRCGEIVRPIFWSCRPESYVHRTANWEQFPNGRWGDSSAASFGSFHDYNLFFAKYGSLYSKFRKMWLSELTCLDNVYDVFVAFIGNKENKQGHKVTNLPWNEDDLAPETSLLADQLEEINSHGFLTINSQPNVNCAPSTHKLFGWGSPGGYVFQKAYLEFFCCEEDALSLLEVVKEYPSVNYHFVNCSGTKNFTNADKKSCNVVTWGVFSGSMILQPTVVDPVAFQFWKDEAFELWLQQWGSLYEKDCESFHLIEHIHDTFFLVNLVDNDYIKGNCLFEIVNRVIDLRTESRNKST